MTAAARAHDLPDIDIAETFAAEQLRIGKQHYAAGQIDQAIEAYQRGLATDPSADHPAIETISELHANLGNAGMVRGDLDLAAANYKAALLASPHLSSCWCNLGTVHMQRGRPQDAVTLYVEALKLNPAHWPSRTNLVQALMATKQYLLAKVLLMELLIERPREGKLYNQLGKLHFEQNEPQAALDYFRQAMELDPADADSLYWTGSLKQQIGDAEGAETAYLRAAQLQPLIRRPAVRFPAEFRVLALFAPFAGNLPTGYLFKDAPYDADTLAVLASHQIDFDALKRDVQVVVNLISDADQGAGLLPLVAELVARLGKPTVNDPGLIARTTRDAVADQLRGLAGCRVAKVLRQKAGDNLALDALHSALPDAATILVRPAGSHGGDDFEKLDTAQQLAAVLAQDAETDRYFIEYIDYRSSDGYFRKYRFLFVDRQILPYHLAISTDWKVHHDSADMADHPWMKEEEEAFLNCPTAIFNAGHYQLLRRIEERIGLDYFGIDCALDRSGNLVVFEVNASMLVHEQNDAYPYKAPFVLRIKQAFDEMLRKFANRDSAANGGV
jgi:tetratricopeptide (TPR) repeat protein